jgi:AGZA family xanthine/uracil permease-like MFS transporter
MERAELRTEAIAGVTTFFTMSYIIFVNPTILAAEGTGMSFSGVMTATVIVAGLMTLFMGLYAKIPFAVAPGMGLNAFFAYTVVLGQGVPWRTALGLVFWSGVAFVVVSVTPIRVAIARAIPHSLRIAAAAGIGIMLTFLGLKNAGFIVPDPTTIVRLGEASAGMLLALAGLAITIFLLHRHSSLAFLGGIFAVTAVAAAFGLVVFPDAPFSKPDFSSVFFEVDFLGALKLALLPAMVSMLMTDLFDSISTFIGVSEAAGLKDERGEPRGLREGLIVDAFASLWSALAGTSAATAYIESSAGIEMGGRTGLTAVFTALCFVPCLFIAPIAGMVPPYATAPVLILVGAFMFRSVTRLSMEKLEDAIPAFLTLILIPLTFSITQGLLWGFISHAALYTMAGRRRELSPAMIALAVVSVGLLVLEYCA